MAEASGARLGREVAIKVLPRDRLADETRRRRFVQEARAASSLNHPNIVTIHEIESDAGPDFIVMELVTGDLHPGRARAPSVETATTVQLFVYDPGLWRGDPFNTVVHVVFTASWTYLVAIHGTPLARQLTGWQ